MSKQKSRLGGVRLMRPRAGRKPKLRAAQADCVVAKGARGEVCQARVRGEVLFQVGCHQTQVLARELASARARLCESPPLLRRASVATWPGTRASARRMVRHALSANRVPPQEPSAASSKMRWSRASTNVHPSVHLGIHVTGGLSGRPDELSGAASANSCWPDLDLALKGCLLEIADQHVHADLPEPRQRHGQALDRPLAISCFRGPALDGPNPQ